MDRRDIATIRAALSTLPAQCRYHGDRTDPDRYGRMTRSEACCDTGIPAHRRKQAEAALARLRALAEERIVTPSAANRPGSTAEQLPDHILALLPPAEYTSTACDTAARLETVAADGVREELRGEVAYWVRWLYERCRLNHKFTGELCASPSHRDQAEDVDARKAGR